MENAMRTCGHAGSVLLSMLSMLLLCGPVQGHNVLPTRPPASGHYATQPGWGELVISTDGPQRRFALDSTTANGQVCALEGQLEGLAAVTRTQNGPACRLTLSPQGSAWAVNVVDMEACRQVCGQRAGLEGVYHPLPETCRLPAREKARADFRQRFERKEFAPALAVLDALASHCGAFIDWFEADALANDRATVLYRLGRPAECLAALGKTRAAVLTRIEELATTLRLPSQQDQAYLPIARATLYNRNLCHAAMATG
jgi:hypothetical protein